MSYAICRIQKIGSGGNVAGIQSHNRRERNRSNSNLDIDFSRSKDNYAFLEYSVLSFNEIAEDIIKKSYKGSKAIRKDAVKVCEVLFTSDNEFFKNNDPKLYFKACFDWACNRYGRANIVSAVVHMDEKTPHLHLDFVPMTKDGRLSAKEVLGGRKDLQVLQDNFYEEVGKQFGLERGTRCDIDNPEDKPRKHKTVEKLKEESAKTLELLAEEILYYRNFAENYHSTYEKLSKEITSSEEECQQLTENVKQLSKELKELKEDYKNISQEYCEKLVFLKDINVKISDCNSRLRGLQNVIKHRTSEITKFVDEENKKLEEKNRIIKDKESNLKKDIEKYEKLQKELDEKETEMNATKNFLDSVENTIVSLGFETQELKKQAEEELQKAKKVRAIEVKKINDELKERRKNAIEDIERIKLQLIEYEKANGTPNKRLEKLEKFCKESHPDIIMKFEEEEKRQKALITRSQGMRR